MLNAYYLITIYILYIIYIYYIYIYLYICVRVCVCVCKDEQNMCKMCAVSLANDPREEELLDD